MGWADRQIEKLKDGESVTFRPKGNSMSGIVESGQICKVEPTGQHLIEKGDVVLCTVKGKQFLHKVGALKHLKSEPSTRFRIENAKGFVNGWIALRSIYGKLTAIDGVNCHDNRSQQIKPRHEKHE